MKKGSIQVPTFYLGAKFKKTVLPNGVIAWGVSSSKYVQSAVHNAQEYLAALPGNRRLLNKAPAPFVGGYKPSLMRSLSWTPSRLTSSSRRLVSCAGVWIWGALTSSLRFQCCPLTFACRVKVTWTPCSVCVPTLRCIKTLGLCLTLLTYLLTWVPSSRLTGSPCMVTLRI
jgi:hypothetical protein